MRRMLAAVAALAFLPIAAQADEGMWTLDHFPAAKVKAAYGFEPTPAFLTTLRDAAVRLPGCSGSFVTRDGLVMTNHHCARGCIQALSDPQHNYIEDGYYAAKPEEERPCPGFRIVSLTGISDVTKDVNAATAGTSGASYVAAQRAAFGRIEKACQGGDAAKQCQVVPLYHGGIYDLYTYRAYTDVRLVFAPEESAAFFGGDPDNFTYPRYDLDCSFVRIYDNGKPLASPAYFPFSPNGSKTGELAFVVGNPGATERLRTIAELTEERDVSQPLALRQLSELRGILHQFSSESPEHARIARNQLFGVENSLKAIWGRENTLLDPAFFGAKERAENAERAAIAKNPALAREYGSAWGAIAATVRREEQLQPAYTWREASGAPGAYLGTARTLIRAAAERQKPDAQRLREYQDAVLPQLRQRLEAPVPVYPDLEQATLTWSLTKIQEFLGEDDPYVRALLGNESPEQVAARVVRGSKLGDPKVREALFAGGEAAVAASDDPAIVLMRKADPLAREIRSQWEAQVQGPLSREDERVARADFALHGLAHDPDATFTLRVSYGAVKGYEQNGTMIQPYTDYAGAYRHATGSDPFELPKSWVANEKNVKLATPLDLVTTNDIIGGNSGSPVVDDRARIIGLIFDGNIQSLGGDYGYDGRQNRAVAVDSRGLLEALRDIYHAGRVVDDITASER